MAESINADFYSAHADRIESTNDSGCIGLWILVCWFECGVWAIWSRNHCTHTKQIAYKDNQRRALWTTDHRRLLLPEPQELVLQSPGEKEIKRKEKG